MLNGFGLQLLRGVGVTLAVACLAFGFGMAAALGWVFLQSSGSNFFARLTGWFMLVIRGLPELLILFVFYFGGSILLNVINPAFSMNAFFAGVLALGLIFAAYASQTFWGAVLAVPSEQVEAAKALGMAQRHIFRRILLPQMWKHALPGIYNLWLVLLKDSALVSLIGLSDLMNQAQLAANTTNNPFKFYAVAALVFLIFTTLSQGVFHLFYRKSTQVTVS